MDFPPGFTSPFTVSVQGIVLGANHAAGDSVVFADFAGTLGDLLVNGEGVITFEITEIAPLVDENDPMAFPVQLDFDTPIPDFTMTPLLEPAVTGVPAPDVRVGNPLVAQNYPNPFTPSTHIRYVIPVASPVIVVVYDYQGKQVRTLVSVLHQEAGEHVVRWDGRDASGRDVAAGVYFYRVVTREHSISQKMVLMN